MNIHTRRRKRRRANAVARFGKKAVRAHRRKTGRTGAVMRKRTPGNAAAYSSWCPNLPGPSVHNLGTFVPAK